jgi:hypothetical protein
MTIVEELYHNNIDISELELAKEIVKHPKLEPLDLWLLPQYPFNIWRRKYDYPRLIESIKRRRPDFLEWMADQGITDEYLLNGYLSDFFENKPLDTNPSKHLIKVTYKGKVNLQSWHNYDFKKQYGREDDPVQYEYIIAYVSYYDWLWQNKHLRFSFINDLDRFNPNTDKEIVYVNTDVRMLKMGSMVPPTNSLGIMLRGKKLEFVNASGLQLRGTILFGDMGNLEFNHSTVDNLKCDELDLSRLQFENCSVKNIQVRNSDLRGWLFVHTYLTGNVIDSKLSFFRIFGGLFNPTFTNTEIDDFEINAEKFIAELDFEKTYRTLSKAALESGNKPLAADLKILELDFIRTKKTGMEKLLMTINKEYWGYGQKPFQLIKISVLVILLLGLFYSFFPQNFSTSHADTNECYFTTLFNSMYFSVVTFTTLGYGDLSPIGFLRFFAALEALFGAITLGFLVAGLTKNS